MPNYSSSLRAGALGVFGASLLVVLSHASSASDRSENQDKDRFAQQMDQFVSSRDFSGVVLVARDGHVLFERAYGLANREHDVPNKVGTKFRVGSVTKEFTAMAVMILAERGKLHLTDSVCKYIENCPKPWADVTVQNLLNHTSGIPDFTNFPDNDRYERLPMTPLETMARFRDKRLEFPPGQQFSYDSSGYLLLGHIIERASAEKYEEFLRKNIYEPLGMSHSGYDHPWIILKDRANGYERKDGQIVNAMLMEMDTPFGGGSMYSTVEDLLRWDQALYTEKLVSRKSLTQVFTPFQGPYPAVQPWQRGLYSRHRYGYGWFITTWFGRNLIWHPGLIHGFCAAIYRYPEDHTLVIVLENIEPEMEGVTDPDLRAEPMIVANGLSAIAFSLPSESNPVSDPTSAAIRRK
jgi:CubicO group peptidase (beta-lactamase class C family)